MPSATKSILLLFLGLQALNLVPALPTTQRLAAQKTTQSSASSAAKVSTAKDGSTIVDQTVVINGLNMRFKVSAPATELVSNNATAKGTLGLNVLFHGDGGQSFFDFPNQGVNANLMGVALLTPDPDLRWGGSDPKDNTGLVRPEGPAHSAAVNELLTKVLPTVVNFDSSKIFLEGVSGGSLLLSGFMIPTFGALLAVPGAIMGCGGLVPQVPVQGDISNLRLHFQSTTDDLAPLKTSIPQAIKAYEKLITGNASLLTADATPVGGHCEFDEKDFVSGVQLLTNNYNSVLTGASPAALVR
ncbi:hypothetical protein B0H16DRAFT_213551 [Mycena metata]|uniref:Cyclin-like f-box protein n=1 Tax=Mycena metata TaxID=1033252 RepID=A0AAD7NQL9_9AGAR|nr:hypothetical protein B0H16DRAFT_213551 [Mycena metata]